MTNNTKNDSSNLDFDSILKGMDKFSEAMKSMDNVSESLRTDTNVTGSDSKSTSEVMEMYNKALESIYEQLRQTTDSDRIDRLDKQKLDLLDRIEREKERQRDYNNRREEKTQENQKWLVGIACTAVVTALGVGTKLFLDNNKSK